MWKKYWHYLIIQAKPNMPSRLKLPLLYMTPLIDQSVKSFCIFLVLKKINLALDQKHCWESSCRRPQINSMAANFAKDMEKFAKIWKITKWGKKREKKTLAKD